MKQTLYTKFITIPGEKIIVVAHEHPYYCVAPIIGIGCVTLLIVTCISVLLVTFTVLAPLLFPTILLLFCAGLFLCIERLTLWYFHFYIITTHKILDIYSSPFRHTVNDVLLDQVRCTEIDIRMNGIINELFGMGDVLITFDRPTHQETLVLARLAHAKELGMKLGDVFAERHDTAIPIWHRQKGGGTLFRFTEEIFPKTTTYHA